MFLTRAQRKEISDRSKENIRRRREAGLPIGRPKGIGKSKLDQHREAIIILLQNGSRQNFIAERYGISPPALNNWIVKHKIKEKYMQDQKELFTFKKKISGRASFKDTVPVARMSTSSLGLNKPARAILGMCPSKREIDVYTDVAKGVMFILAVEKGEFRPPLRDKTLYFSSKSCFQELKMLGKGRRWPCEEYEGGLLIRINQEL